MKFFKNLWILLSLVAFMASCDSKTPTYLICGEVEFIKQFPREYSLRKQKPYKSDFPGVVSIFGVDTLFFGINTTKDHFLELYSLNTGNKLADMFVKGQGPREYASAPRIQRIVKKNDSLYACMVYNNAKEVLLLDILSSARCGQEMIIKKNYPDNFTDVKNIIPFENGDSLMICNDYRDGGFKRFLMHSNGKRCFVDVFESRLPLENINFNTVSSLPIAFRNDSLIAEACITLNQINVYSPKLTTHRKTICVGTESDDILSMDKRSRGDKPRAYGGVKLWKDKLIFLYHGIKEKDYQNNKGASELQVFDFDMKPVSRIKIPIIASAFHVDNNGNLYIFNPLGDSEYIYKYNIINML